MSAESSPSQGDKPSREERIRVIIQSLAWAGCASGFMIPVHLFAPHVRTAPVAAQNAVLPRVTAREIAPPIDCFCEDNLDWPDVAALQLAETGDEVVALVLDAPHAQ